MFYPSYFLLQYICHLIVIIILFLVLMDTMQSLVLVEKQVGNICLADSATMHTILQYRKSFTHLYYCEGHVIMISNTSKLIEGSRRASILLPMCTEFLIKDTLYSPQSQSNLLSFKDILLNSFHVETGVKGSKKFLYITSIKGCQKQILEKLPNLSSGLYGTFIFAIEKHIALNLQFKNQTLKVWHDQLGHPGSSIMHQIIENSVRHPLKNQKIPSHKFCVACVKDKLVTRPSLTKVNTESPAFVQWIQGEICGPIHPPCRPFRYLMVLIDASTRWSYVTLLSTHNLAFTKLFAHIIILRVQFPDYPIKFIGLYDASEFTSRSFNDYCLAIGIDVEHPMAYTYT